MISYTLIAILTMNSTPKYRSTELNYILNLWTILLRTFINTCQKKLDKMLTPPPSVQISLWPIVLSLCSDFKQRFFVSFSSFDKVLENFLKIQKCLIAKDIFFLEIMKIICLILCQHCPGYLVMWYQAYQEELPRKRFVFYLG